MEKLYNFTLDNWIAILALLVSVITFIKSVLENRIKIHADINSFDSQHNLNFYNESKRVITITYYELYSASSKLKLFSRRSDIETGCSGGHTVSIAIEPYQHSAIIFKDYFSIGRSHFKRNIYLKVWISGKPYRKTIKVH